MQEGGQSVRITLKEFEKVNAFLNRKEREDKIVSQDDNAPYLPARRRAKRTYYVEKVREGERVFEPYRTRG